MQVDKSREIYGEARTKLQALEGFGELLAIEELRPSDAQQWRTTFRGLRAGARGTEGTDVKIASEWAPDEGRQSAPSGRRWARSCHPRRRIHSKRSHDSCVRRSAQKSLELTEEELREAAVGELPLASFIGWTASTWR